MKCPRWCTADHNDLGHRPIMGGVLHEHVIMQTVLAGVHARKVTVAVAAVEDLDAGTMSDTVVSIDGGDIGMGPGVASEVATALLCAIPFMVAG